MPRLRIAYLAHSDRAGPTSRYRIYPFREQLAKAGIDVEIMPAFGAGYYAAERHQGARRWLGKSLGALQALARRLSQLPRTLAADGVVVEREAFPWLPPLIELLLKARFGGYVLELDDAIYLSAGRRLKYPLLLRMADRVIAGNPTLAAYVEQRGARVVVVPTVVDPARYLPKQTYTLGSPPRIGWVGLASNLPHLASIAEPLRAVCARYGARLTVVSARRPELQLPLDFVPWSEAGEVEAIGNFDLGIMPLIDTPFARGKCGLKLLQYMAAGVPVIASTVGANREIVRPGVNGLLATEPGDWSRALAELLDDLPLREKLGRAGRHSVETEYSVTVWGERVARLYSEMFQGVS